MFCFAQRLLEMLERCLLHEAEKPPSPEADTPSPRL